MDAAIGQYVVDVDTDHYQAKGECNHSFNCADCGEEHLTYARIMMYGSRNCSQVQKNGGYD